jgi:hypothetical protein
MKVVVLVATHRRAVLPQGRDYLPIQVGRALASEDLGYQSDATGDNISAKNTMYSELTALYWAWKNLPSDYLGLVHYRRFFSDLPAWRNLRGVDVTAAWSDATIEAVAGRGEFIVPRKRRYYIETLGSHYEHTHHRAADQLGVVTEVLRELHPDSPGTWQKVLRRRWGYMFNMFLAPRAQIDAYCSWVFPVLAELETRIDTTGFSPFDMRYIGRLAELLWNAWLEQNHIIVAEADWVTVGQTNPAKKAAWFLAAKLGRRRYRASA